MKIYLSYANMDFELANRVKSELRKLNHEIILINRTENLFIDVASVSLEEIKSSDLILFILTDNSNNSNWISIELTASVKRHKNIIGIKFDDSVLSEELIFSLGSATVINEHSFKRNISKFISIIEG